MQTFQGTPSVGQRLIADHRALDTLLDALHNDIHGGDPSVCQASWDRFEQALLNHIDAEELFLLPSFEQIDRTEAAAIRQEHATLRHLVADMGVRLELHAVKEENVKRLVVALKTHAAREEVFLYKWADQLAPELENAFTRKLSARRAHH
jgi:hemerythrin superfamily protein